jgi:hypothetical protein
MYSPDRGQDLRWTQWAVDVAALCSQAAATVSVGSAILGENSAELAAGCACVSGVAMAGGQRM